MRGYRLASHDSMSHARPEKWWMRPFHFIARCQSRGIAEQYAAGARMFDLRVKWTSRGWRFAHGYMTFRGDVNETLRQLDGMPEPVYVRIILEYNRKPKDIEEITSRFMRDFGEKRTEYPNITFFEYRRKYDWEQVFSDEGMPAPEIYQAVSSMTWRVWDDWFPALYARAHNRDILRQGTDKEWLMIDFI